MAQLTTEEKIARLYVATFDRAPDADGLAYWVDMITVSGWSIQQVAQSFFYQSETILRYPASLSTGDFIDQVYENVLNRSADSAGKSYWTTELENGQISRDAFIIAILNGADSGGTDDDQSLMANKLAVSIDFAVTNALNDTELASYVIQDITSDQECVLQAKAIIAAHVAASTGDSIQTYGDAASNLIQGSASNDWIEALGGDDTVYTGDGVNFADGGSGDDHLYGNIDNDTLVGNAGADTLYGDAGDDALFGNSGNDALHGDAGSDTLYGGDDGDYLYGGSDADYLYGGNGNDVLYGEAGDDFLYGGDGSDQMYGGEGANWLDGEAGNDTIYGGSSVDTIYGGLDDDTLYGDGGNDILDGMAGNDTIYGGLGDDTINGNSGSDTLNGSEGNDIISAQEGNDTIIGGGGADLLSGGSGTDIFSFNVGESTASEMDTIMDFVIGSSGDILKLINQGTEVVQSTSVNITGAASLSAAIDLASAGDGSTNGIINWFWYQDNTYIIEDCSANATYDSTTDIVVKAQGLINLTYLNNYLLFQ